VHCETAKVISGRDWLVGNPSYRYKKHSCKTGLPLDRNAICRGLPESFLAVDERSAAHQQHVEVDQSEEAQSSEWHGVSQNENTKMARNVIFARILEALDNVFDLNLGPSKQESIVKVDEAPPQQ
jgi:hypothetical protein